MGGCPWPSRTSTRSGWPESGRAGHHERGPGNRSGFRCPAQWVPVHHLSTGCAPGLAWLSMRLAPGGTICVGRNTCRRDPGHPVSSNPFQGVKTDYQSVALPSDVMRQGSNLQQLVSKASALPLSYASDMGGIEPSKAAKRCILTNLSLSTDTSVLGPGIRVRHRRPHRGCLQNTAR